MRELQRLLGKKTLEAEILKEAFTSARRLVPRPGFCRRERDHLWTNQLPRNAIADGANSAATCASAQGHQLGIADKEAATGSNGARADSLAYESRVYECRRLRGGKRKKHSREYE
jgi:hypothetical protein